MEEALKYTLITGGSRGIGKALAGEFAGRGMNLLLVAKPDDGLEAAAEELDAEYPVEVHFLTQDLRDSDGPRNVWEWCRKEDYRVDILVNNAGVAGTTFFEESDPSYSDERILVNVRALVLLTRYFLPELKTHGKAYILNIGSMSSYYSIAYKSVYSASKAFVNNFTRALKQELRGSMVSITVVNPNGVRTNEGTLGRIDSHSRFARRFLILEVGEIARISVDKMLKGKTVVIPGFMNRLVVLITRMIPAGLRERLSAKIFQKELTGV